MHTSGKVPLAFTSDLLAWAAHDQDLSLVADGTLDGLKTVAEMVLGQATTLFGADGGVVEMVEGDEMVYRAIYNMDAKHLDMRLRRDSSLSGLCVEERKALVAEDTRVDPRVDAAACQKVGVGAIIVSPMFYGDHQVMGVLKVFFRQPTKVNAARVGLLASFAEMLGSAINDVRLVGEIQARDATAFAAVRDASPLTKEALEQLPHITWTSDAMGHVEYYNSAWYKYSGQTVEEAVGLGWQSVVHPDDAASCMERWAVSFATGENFMVMVRIKRALDGAYRYHLATSQPVRADDGHILKWAGSSIDIHDFYRAPR
jgi:PAS domain S-box-containing protein